MRTDRQGEQQPVRGLVAVFVDRDGVINDQTAFVNKPDDFRLLPGAAAAIRRLNEAKIPVVVVTNQGGIALGYLTEDDLAAIHQRMADLLAAEGAHVDAVYYSPYFPNGTIPRYAKESPDRKPGIGMLERARDELGIDLPKSFLVGDATTDILAGLRAGCTTILVQTGQAGTDGKEVVEPNYTVADLPAAVELILSQARHRSLNLEKPSIRRGFSLAARQQGSSGSQGPNELNEPNELDEPRATGYKPPAH